MIFPIYRFVGNPVLATGIMSFLLHEVFYFGRCIPWIIVEKIPSLRKYKLQEGKVTSPAEQWRCTKYVLLTHFTVELPQIWGFHPMAEYFGMATHHVPFPSWTTIISQVILFFIIEGRSFLGLKSSRLLKMSLLCMKTSGITGRIGRFTRVCCTSESTNFITSSPLLSA